MLIRTLQRGHKLFPREARMVTRKADSGMAPAISCAPVQRLLTHFFQTKTKQARLLLVK